MKTFPRSLPLLFASGVLAAGPAYAEGPTPAPKGVAIPAPQPPDVRAELPELARRAWDSAKQLAGASDYKGALVEFQRAFDLSHNPRVLYNVGVTEKLLTHYARAVDAWEKELRDGEKELVASEIQELKNAIAIVQQFVSTLDVTANEGDATLLVDDSPVGKTPFTAPVRIDVGKHALRLTKDGFVDASQNVDVPSGGKTPVTFRLEPTHKTALVRIAVGGAPSATILIDGRDVGPAPFTGELSADKHTIEARAPGYLTVGQTIDVVYKQPVSISLTLSAERHTGRLRVAALEGATILVDGMAVGSGTWEGVVSSVGGHQVVVRKPGFQAVSTEVYVADDQTRELDVPLNREVNQSWVAWGVGTIVVVAGGVVAGYFVFKPSQPSPFVGDLSPGITTANHGLHF